MKFKMPVDERDPDWGFYRPGCREYRKRPREKPGPRPTGYTEMQIIKKEGG